MSVPKSRAASQSAKNTTSLARPTAPGGEGFNTTSVQPSSSRNPISKDTATAKESLGAKKRPRPTPKATEQPKANQSTSKPTSLTDTFRSSSPFSRSSSTSYTKPPLPLSTTSCLDPATNDAKTALKARLSRVDWSQCDRSITDSALFRVEYERWGEDVYGRKKKNKIRAETNVKQTHVKQEWENPSWAKEGDVLGLCQKFDAEEFVAGVYCRDVLGSSGAGGRDGLGIRAAVVRGMDMFLVGVEFPFRKVLIMGLVVGERTASQREKAKTSTTSIFVDDGTGEVECECVSEIISDETASALRAQSRAKAKAEKDPPPSPNSKWVHHKAQVQAKRAEKPSFEVGQWVKVVGTVANGWKHPNPDRLIKVESIDAVEDINVPVQHLLLVNRLHHEVYSRKFDLNARLEEISLKEREIEKDWEGSQATASEAGSPRKKPRKAKLAHPGLLPPSEITLKTFGTYVTAHLHNHFRTVTSSNPSRPPTPSPNTRLSKSHLPDRYESDDYPPDEIVSKPFSLGDIEKNKRLVKFAKMLANRREKEKREKILRSKKNQRSNVAPKEVTTAGGGEENLWVAKGHHSDDSLDAPKVQLGRMGGSAVLLPPSSSNSSTLVTKDSSSVRKGKSRVKFGDEDDDILTGKGLEKGINRVFVDVLRLLRTDGVIVLALPDGEGDIKMADIDSGAEERSARLERKREWETVDESFGGPAFPKKSKAPSPQSSCRYPPSVYQPKTLPPLWDDDSEEEMQSTTPKAKSKTPSSCPSIYYNNSKPTTLPELVDDDSEEEGHPTNPKASTSASRLPFSDSRQKGKLVLPPIYEGSDDEPNTPKAPSRTGQRQSSSVPPLTPTKSRSPNLDDPTSWSTPLTSISDSTINSTSILATQKETYELVTVSNLSVPILACITQKMSLPVRPAPLSKPSTTHAKTKWKNGKKEDVEDEDDGKTRSRGVSEKAIRNHLGGDARWEAVAESSHMVKNALTRLVDLGKVYRVGSLFAVEGGRARY